MKLSFLRRACALALSLCLLSSPALALSLGSIVRIDPGKAIARNGGALALDRLGNQPVDGVVRVLTPNGVFLGLGCPENGELQVLRLLGGSNDG